LTGHSQDYHARAHGQKKNGADPADVAAKIDQVLHNHDMDTFEGSDCYIRGLVDSSLNRASGTKVLRRYDDVEWRITQIPRMNENDNDYHNRNVANEVGKGTINPSYYLTWNKKNTLEKAHPITTAKKNHENDCHNCNEVNDEDTKASRSLAGCLGDGIIVGSRRLHDRGVLLKVSSLIGVVASILIVVSCVESISSSIVVAIPSWKKTLLR